MSLAIPEVDGWVVRRVTTLAARKPYQCPSCGNEIAEGQQHVVAWPEGEEDTRRHFHIHCWKVAANRGRVF